MTIHLAMFIKVRMLTPVLQDREGMKKRDPSTKHSSPLRDDDAIANVQRVLQDKEGMKKRDPSTKAQQPLTGRWRNRQRAARSPGWEGMKKRLQLS